MTDLARIDVVAVEADTPSRVALYKALQGAGVRRIRLATGIEHAVALAGASRPDIVVTGLDLPDGSGFMLAARLREQAPAREAAAPAKDLYGIDASAASGFAGDLDELLGGTSKTASAGDQRSASTGGNVPVIVALSKPTREIVTEARDMGVAGIVLKPIAPAEFGLRLKAALKPKERETVWSL